MGVVLVLALAILLGPLVAEAQRPDRVYRIGLLDYSAAVPSRENWWSAFRQQMGELGYVEGKNVRFEPRWAQGDEERLATLAGELVSRNMDAIVTAGTPAAIAAKRATSTIPIVTASGVDLLELGLISSLRHPGGNLTGVTSISAELSGKRFEFMRLIAPRTSRIAIVWDEKNPGSRLIVQETEAAATAAGVTLQSVPVRSGADLEAGFGRAARGRAGALIVVQSPMFFAHLKQLADLAVRHRLPTVAGSREYVEAGCLASYGVDFPELFRRAGVFVDKILRGAAPGDLPVEQPTKFELVISMRAARALGLTVPSSLVQRADHIIQ